jgi:nucleotide-binding universal stress UspA family protein
MIRVQKILYPTDFSPYSNQAYFHAIALADKHGASLTVLYVYTPGIGIPGEPGADNDAARRYWRNQLEQIRPVDPGIAVNHIFLEGDPAAEIVRYARDAGMDLVVMGTHGRTGVERLLMGSVAERTLRDAPCSVLIVKLPKGVPAPEKGSMAAVGNPA